MITEQCFFTEYAYVHEITESESAHIYGKKFVVVGNAH